VAFLLRKFFAPPPEDPEATGQAPTVSDGRPDRGGHGFRPGGGGRRRRGPGRR